MLFIITGHPRSGTELLYKLCNSHPDIRLTLEFGCLRTLGVPLSLFSLGIAGRAWARRREPILDVKGSGRASALWASYRYEFQFIDRLRRMQPPLVMAADVHTALQALSPEVRIVGDKFPDYVFNLDQLAGIDAAKVLVVYRDCRDVVASYLSRLHDGWNRLPVFGQFATPRQIAQRWLTAIAAMERHENGILKVRYEDLVAAPAQEMNRIAAWLEVDADGFAMDDVSDGSVGNYRRRLSAEALAEVLDVAEPTLARLGYV